MPRRSRSRERHSRAQHGSKVRSPARCRACRDHSPGPVARHLGSHRRRDSHPRTHKERGSSRSRSGSKSRRSQGTSRQDDATGMGAIINVVDWLNAVDEYGINAGFINDNDRLHYNATALPRGNGQVERYNRTLLESMSTMGAGADDDEWDQNLPNIQLGLNGTVNSAIGVTPSEALMRYRVYSQVMLEGEGREVVDVTRVRDRMVAATESYQADQKRRFDRHRSKARQYSQNDLVLIRVTCSPATGTSRKLCAKWLPEVEFRIVERVGQRICAPGCTSKSPLTRKVSIPRELVDNTGAVQHGGGDIEVALAEWFWEDRALGGCTAVVADEDPKD
jgi:hypothetical protein